MKSSTVEINSKYIDSFIKKNGMSRREVSRSIGTEGNYVTNCLLKGTMNKSILLFMCTLTGMDYKEATTIGKADKPETVSTENAELLISYIQDVGKIASDIVREVREDRTKTTEMLGLIYKELHELSTYLKSETVDKRQTHSAINNACQTMNNTTQAILGVVRARK